MDVRSVSLELALMFGIMRFLSQAREFSASFGTDAWTQLESAATALCAENGESDPFSEEKNLIDDLYFNMIDFRKRAEIPALFISVSLAGEAMTAIIKPNSGAKEDLIEKMRRSFGSVKSRIENVGGSLVIERRTLPVAPVSRLAEKVLKTENQVRRSSLARAHASALAEAWVEGNREEAALHAELAFKYDSNLEAKPANNLGYFLMETGSLAQAEQMFTRAIETAGDDAPTRALSVYNLATVLARTGKVPVALKTLEDNKPLVEGATAEENKVGCLQLPELRQGQLVFAEVSQPDMKDLYTRAIAVFRSCCA